ncbi:MAG: class I SAM-dependent DNA methyltransferase [Acholeplasmataceae bacterium]
MFSRTYDLLMADVDYTALYLWLKPYLSEDDLIADVGCGSGYLLKELLRAGHRAIGIDIDESMLALARERLLEAELPAALYVHDIREPFESRFDVLIGVFDVINYFKGFRSVFKNLFQALNDGGLLIFDAYKESVLKDYAGYREEGRKPIRYTWTIETKNERIEHVVSVGKNSDVIVQYVHKIADLKEALQELGFDVRVRDGIDPRKHYVIARK